MWSFAYGLIALAVAAFVLTYAALHAPYFAPANIADQLYSAKLKAFAAVKNGARWESPEPPVNSTYVKVVYAQVPEPFPLAVPVAYRTAGREANVHYEVYAAVAECREVVTRSGQVAKFFVVVLSHPLEMPWIEAYGLAVTNMSYYYQLYREAGKPPLLAVDDPGFKNATTADAKWKYAQLTRAEWALVRRPDGSYTLYVAAPREADAVYIVDYPFGVPLACP